MKKYLLPLFTAFGGICIWEMAVRLGNVPKWILPSPSLIITSLWDARLLIALHIPPTLIETFVGLAIAIGVGVACACLIEWSPVARRLLHPLLVISQTIPTIAIAPLLVIWFGFGITSKVIIIALVCFFPIAINMTEGFRAIDPAWLKIFRTMGAGPWRIFRTVKLPAALPGFFSGLKLAGAYSILGAVIAEWFGAEKGLGILLMRSAKSYLTERVFGTIFIITLCTLALVALIDRIARISIPWHYRNNK